MREIGLLEVGIHGKGAKTHKTANRQLREQPSKHLTVKVRADFNSINNLKFKISLGV